MDRNEKIMVGDVVKFKCLLAGRMVGGKMGISEEIGTVLPSPGFLVRIEMTGGILLWVSRDQIIQVVRRPGVGSQIGMTRDESQVIVEALAQGGIEARSEDLLSGLQVVCVDRPTGGTSRQYVLGGLWVCDEVENCQGSKDVYHSHEEDQDLVPGNTEEEQKGATS